MVMPPTPGLSEADLEMLDAFLMSDQAPENCMQLSDLDGFLTAVAIGPELVMPSEWLPTVWGDGEPAFETVEQAQSIINAIMVRYNDILHRLQDHPDGIEPLFWETSAGQVVAGDWAEGFMDGVALRKDSWHPLFHSDEGAALLAPILAFVHDPDESYGQFWCTGSSGGLLLGFSDGLAIAELDAVDELAEAVGTVELAPVPLG